MSSNAFFYGIIPFVAKMIGVKIRVESKMKDLSTKGCAKKTALNACGVITAMAGMLLLIYIAFFSAVMRPEFHGVFYYRKAGHLTGSCGHERDRAEFL